MFASVDTKIFGEQITICRKNAGLSQKDVYENVSISTETLRRIENGYTVPSYETLEKLGHLYKCDLFRLFIESRHDQTLYNIYQDLEYILTLNSPSETFSFINDVREKVNTIDSSLIDITEKKQIILLLEAIEAFDDNNINLALIDKLIYAIKLTNHRFTLSNFDQLKYTQIESHCLYLIALSYCELDMMKESISALHYLLYLSKRNPLTSDKLIVKIYFQLSYNYHIIDEHWNALLYSEQGLFFALNKELFYGLENLYARIGIAQFFLQQSNYRTSLQYSLEILLIKGNTNTRSRYIDVFNNKYNLGYT